MYIYIYICSICRCTFRCTTAHQCSSERAWIDTGTECSNHFLGSLLKFCGIVQKSTHVLCTLFSTVKYFIAGFCLRHDVFSNCTQINTIYRCNDCMVLYRITNMNKFFFLRNWHCMYITAIAYASMNSMENLHLRRLIQRFSFLRVIL